MRLEEEQRKKEEEERIKRIKKEKIEELKREGKYLTKKQRIQKEEAERRR